MITDLHSHSTHSDGALSPAALAQRAHRNGVALWAMTDHDQLGGLAEAASAAGDLGLAFVPGVEISVSFAGETVHILGLGIDPADPDLVNGLSRTRAGRIERAREMADGLARVGIQGAFDGAMAHAGQPESVSRTHFARWLVERGICSDTNSVFRRYLTEGKPGFVTHRWASLGDALRWIRGAGGKAAIAHPARYRLTPNEEFALFTEFVGHGGVAVEVVSASHTERDQARVAALAREFGLRASGGSDFHAPGESRWDLGAGPPLPEDLPALWPTLWPNGCISTPT
ncbi:MAG: PHP domain-containing protein [Aquabacterium sp.]